MFTDKYGLTITKPYGNTQENAFLYTVELFVILRNKGRDTSRIEFIIETALSEMYEGNGIYKQNPSYPHPMMHISSNAKMSHDQLTAIMVYFAITGRKDKIREIMDRFTFGISYNNTGTKLVGWHPRDLIFYHILNGSKLAYIFLPLLYIITFFTFIKDKKHRAHGTFKKTDGEILYYIKRESTNIFKYIDVFCNLLIKIRFGSWDKVFSTYFKQLDHPINIIRNK